jgi:hypothetical protein
MFQFYYKVWGSTFLKIKAAQNGDVTAALPLALMVITAANFMNFLFIICILVLFFKIQAPIYLVPNSKALSVLFLAAIFFVPNYLLLVNNGKHEELLARYQHSVNKNLGYRYFLISSGLLLIFLFTTILFPDLYELKPRN